MRQHRESRSCLPGDVAPVASTPGTGAETSPAILRTRSKVIPRGHSPRLTLAERAVAVEYPADADRPLTRVGALTNLVRERVRQIESAAALKMAEALRDWTPDPGPGASWK